MTLIKDRDSRALIAFNRFGLGAKAGGMGRINNDPLAAVEKELDDPGKALIKRPSLPNYDQACRAVHTNFDNENGYKEQEITARLQQHLKPEVGFVERLVLFFSNHFSMSINKDGAIRATIGQLERDVIRRNVLGSFRDMLVGVMKHPAMIRFLDNDDSIGPNSVAGKAWGAGQNHNLAREILELHTLGVGGGYTENDIKALALVLTGWSFVRGWEAEGHYNDGNRRNRGKFIFRKTWHEPGTQTVLGKNYNGGGTLQGDAVLTALAHHPSTAQFLAFKLVRHFITDLPTPDLVEPVAEAYRRSGGNLKATAKALIGLPQAWTLPMTKLRTPYELQVAAMRALDHTYDPKDRWPFNETLGALRHKPWERPAPDGYPDETVYWIGPDAMRIRLETAQLNAVSLGNASHYQHDASYLANRIFGGALSKPSREAIGAAAGFHDGLTMLFMIPEFQRR